jgi:aspartyl-tRNA(Asn)/glutamyl-tRNA(Gln) amidotransferase subunit C
MSDAADLEVAYVARLARLELSPEETDLFQRQLGDVLKYVQKLSEIDLTKLDTAARPNSLADVFRADESRDYFTAAEALANAPRQRDGLFIVPKVLE